MSMEKRYHNGQEYVFVDYSGINDVDVLLERLEKVIEQTRSQPQDWNTLPSLIDLRGTVLHKKFIERSKEFTKEDLTDANPRVALLGDPGPLRKILINSFNRFTGQNYRIFDEQQRALNYILEID
jgi:hypothetical protein